MKRNKLKRLLDKLESNTLTDREAALLRNWYNSFGEEEVGLSSLEKQESAQRIENEIIVHVRQLIETDTHAISLRKRRVWMQVAAAAILALGVLFWKAELLNPGVYKTKNSTQSASLIEVKTAGRQLKQLTLSDSSIIYVNANSTVRIPTVLHSRTREVYLDRGEAYFEVAKDPMHPFIVHIGGGLKVEVLGTAFNVKAYQALEDISIAVNHGKVRVSNKASLLEVLEASQGISYRKSDGRVSKMIHTPEHINAWTKGIIRLEEAKFTELALAMHNLYGVKLESASPHATDGYQYNIVLRSSRTLEETMEIINRIHRTNYKRYGDVVRIYQ